MKEILEEHRAKLSEAEKRTLWGAVHDELRRPRGFWRRYRRYTLALGGAAAALLIVFVALVQQGRVPEAPLRVEPPAVLPGGAARPSAPPEAAAHPAPSRADAAGQPPERDRERRPAAPAPASSDRARSGAGGDRDASAGTGGAETLLSQPPPSLARGDEVDVASTATASVFDSAGTGGKEAAKEQAGEEGHAGEVLGGVVGGVVGGIMPPGDEPQLAPPPPPPGSRGRDEKGRAAASFAAAPSVEAKREREQRHPISVGGTDPVNGEAFDAMFFQHYGVNPFVDPQEDPLATFAVDVDTASFSLARAYLRRGELPPPEAIRVEEFVNALPHDYAPPRWRPSGRSERDSRGDAFAIHLEAAPSPFGEDLLLLRVGLKGREVSARDRKPAVLTFVVDVSGSMEREDRLETVKRALRMLLDEMQPDDRVGLVVYGTDARVVLPHVGLRERFRVERAIDSLVPEGSTNAAAGLREGYDLADQGYRAGWINRILLCSDGVANVGLTSAETILARIGAEARRGIELTTIGFGMGNYNDVLMEKLADQGDGSYHYVDGLDEARKVFVENLTGTLQTIARQTKVQVEFDAETVRRYRLLGYENRDVADRDFRNDRVDAGEVGAGHEVTALFELALERGARGGDLATVRLRYEDPETGRVTEAARSLDLADVERRFDAASPSFRLDAAVAEFAEILRRSYWARDGSLEAVLRVADPAAREIGRRPEARDFLGMVEEARQLWRDAAPAPGPREEDHR